MRNTQGSTGFRQGQAPGAASSLVDLGRLPGGEAFRSSLEEERNRLANRLRAEAPGVALTRTGRLPEEASLLLVPLCLWLFCIFFKIPEPGAGCVRGHLTSGGGWVRTDTRMQAVGTRSGCRR